MGATVIRVSCTPFKLLDDLVETLKDAVDGAITGAAIGWLERRGYRIDLPGERRCPQS